VHYTKELQSNTVGKYRANLSEREYLEHAGLDGRIILKRIFKK
jgi:hypothetical protein